MCRPRTYVAALLAAAVIAAGVLWPVGFASGRPGRPEPVSQTNLDRFGVNVLGSISPYDVGALHIGWYLNWGVSVNPPRPGGIEFAQVIRLRDDPVSPQYDYWPPDWTVIQDAIASNPGALWLIGNEPDHIGQDNCLAAAYAARYHECYYFIKQRDPTARVSPGGLVQVTPLRLHWLTDVVDAYEAAYGDTMPADAWNIHSQILCETCGYGAFYPPGLAAYQHTEGTYYTSNDAADVSVFIEQLQRFRVWIRDHGYRELPLIISEFGVLQPSGCGYLCWVDVACGNQMVRDFMTGSFDYCLSAVDSDLGFPGDDYRMVQKWAWYSLNARMSEPDCSYINSANGSLYDWQDPDVLTDFGRHFMEYTNSLVPGPTATPSPTPTVTPTPTPHPLLVGATTPQRYQPAGHPSWVTSLRLRLHPVGGMASVFDQVVITDAYGVFTATVDAVGTYDIGVKGLHTVEHRVTDVAVNLGSTYADFGTLLEGDANDDNRVGILDYSLLYASYDLSDPRCDFNQDHTVDVLDYSLLYSNYDTAGPIAYLTQGIGPPIHINAGVVLQVTGGDVVQGQTLPIHILLLAGERGVDGCQLRLQYDPGLLRVVDHAGALARQIVPGPDLTQVIRNRVDHLAGEIYYVAGAALGKPRPRESILVAEFRVVPVTSTGTTKIRIAEAVVARAGMPLEVVAHEGTVNILEGHHVHLPQVYRQYRHSRGHP